MGVGFMEVLKLRVKKYHGLVMVLLVGIIIFVGGRVVHTVYQSLSYTLLLSPATIK